jgi:hypothetical protein
MGYETEGVAQGSTLVSRMSSPSPNDDKGTLASAVIAPPEDLVAARVSVTVTNFAISRSCQLW